MIIIFEQDLRLDNDHRFYLLPTLFKGNYKYKLTWRICWGLWSISFFPEKGIKDFLDYIASNKATWYYKSTR